MGRPRGFIFDWQPREQTEYLVLKVQKILTDNSDILPLTLRQIFYMLVTGFGFDKTEKAYKRLCETMNKARRAQWIDMDDIRDDGFTEHDSSGWYDDEHFLNTYHRAATNFTLDRQANQPRKLMLWCEAAGMAPQLAAAVKDYQVPVLSSGGFDSVTTKHKMAKRFSEMGDVVVLHIGDHDPSGVHICSSLDEDLRAFVGHYGGTVAVTRLAVTPEQVDEMDLPTAPPKSRDRRSFSGRTTQAEAIPPRRLREIVRAAVDYRVDPDLFADTLKREKPFRESVVAKTRSILP